MTIFGAKIQIVFFRKKYIETFSSIFLTLCFEVDAVIHCEHYNPSTNLHLVVGRQFDTIFWVTCFYNLPAWSYTWKALKKCWNLLVQKWHWRADTSFYWWLYLFILEMELYSKHLDGIFFLEPIGVELETSLTVKVAWVFFQVTVFENLLKCLIFQ